MIFKEEVMITPFHCMRTLHIYVPDEALHSDERYPVLYMYDGHNLFDDEEATYGKSWGMRKWLDENQAKLIVVGLECNHEGTERLSEFSPYDFNFQKQRIHGKGKILMRWMVEELKPLIDQELPTLPQRETTAIGGSSMGGLMALYSVLHHNETFSKAAALSPHIFGMVKPLQAEMNRFIDPDTQIYISWGSKECRSKRQLAMVTNCACAFANEKPWSVYLNCKVDGEHNEASWEAELPVFMRYLFKEG